MRAFLMIGQSNMAGRGDFGEVPEIINDHCFMLRNGRWQPMREPVNADRCFFPQGDMQIHSGIGLAPAFADALAKTSKEDIGLIPCADGGTRISQWQPGEALFDNAVFQTKLALRNSELAGILWHQGESDSHTAADATAYKQRFLTMYNALMNELNFPNVPLILGELGDYLDNYKSGELKYWRDINRALHELASEIPNCAIASAAGLTSRFDNLHFDSRSCREMGERYYREYIKITCREQH